MSDEIIDNRARNRYELTVDGFTAHVDYARKPGVITFIHTIVPEQLGGRGIGSRLAQFALDDARRNGEKVIPQCSFIAAYIKRHAEYQDLVLA
ncbi:MAG: GNAT family N-acetyltransferase [Rudaea sp.]|uniref:GNAT family N-acetyltransferase n=1 Tax=Rudaea sp. TaxID=2136325 RepID=UPI0039E2633A